MLVRLASAFARAAEICAGGFLSSVDRDIALVTGPASAWLTRTRGGYVSFPLSQSRQPMGRNCHIVENRFVVWWSDA
jgi:hypothetical protein